MEAKQKASPVKHRALLMTTTAAPAVVTFQDKEEVQKT